MRFRYTEWDGTEFPTADSLGLFDSLMELIMHYGDQALESMPDLERDPEQSELLKQLIDDGMLEKAGARWRLTPRAINSMQRKALMEVFRNLRSGVTGGHETIEQGRDGERTDGTRPYTFGDPVSDIEMSRTLKNALNRSGPGTPIRIGESDFELHRTEGRTRCSMALLIDMSGSMSRWNRFYHAKKCAMAMHALIRQRFPADTIDLIGFHSTAEVIPEHRLPFMMPKPVTLYDPTVRARVPLDQAEKAPQYFTNLQMGMMMARRVLARRGGENKQIFIITDGQPTAHVQGDYLYVLYPPDRSTKIATLTEARQVAADGIRVATFALTEDYFYMDWVGFVDQLTRLTRGVAFYCAGGDLSTCIMESYLSGRKTKTYIA
jgi:uncharacterized protein with von Willebrand factor type A (vWA) domain